MFDNEKDDYESSELIMRSGINEMNWWIDLPKLSSLTTKENESWSFEYPRFVTLEGDSYHSILIIRDAISFHRHSPKGV